MHINGMKKNRLGWGSKFMESLFDELKFINNPLIEPRKIYLDFHRNSLRKFPYYIYHRKEVDKQLIIIFAVLHKKQDSSEFYKRV